MAKKKNLRGIAKAEQLHKRRSESAKRTDLSKRAKPIRPTRKGIKKWKKKQGQTDIFMVDSPPKCKICGSRINSRWKNLCYKCYHEKKGDYDPKKLQKIYGGTK